MSAFTPGLRFLPWLLVGHVLLIGVDLGGGAAKLPVEARSREIIRGMAETGDWTVPRVGGRPFLSKPPLYHWLGAAAARLEGRASWRAVRLPSALAAVVVLGLTAAWGTMLGGRALGAAAALATGAMSLFLIMARRGAPDMVFAAACVAALYLFERMWRRGGRALVPLFAAAVALAFMAKAHAVLVMVGLPVAGALTACGAWRRTLRADVLLWLALGAAAASAWYLRVYFLMPQEALYWLKLEGMQPTGIELVGHTGRHFRAPWYFLYRIWDIALPASAFLPFAAWFAWRRGLWRGMEGMGFVLWSLLIIFAAVSIVPQKQAHYLLPALPLLGLLIAHAILEALRAPEPGEGRFLTASMTALVGVLLGVLVFALVYTVGVRGLAEPLSAFAAAAGAGGLALCVRRLLQGRRAAFFLVALAVVWCLGLVYFGSFEAWKSLDRQRSRAGGNPPAAERMP